MASKLKSDHYLNFAPFILLMSFIQQKCLIVNLFLFVIKIYNREIENITSEASYQFDLCIFSKQEMKHLKVLEF